MKRSRLEVNINILKALADHGKMKATHITYKTFLNNKCLNENLEFLEEKKLVQVQGKKRKIYEITNQGLKALAIAKRINNTLQVFNEPLQ